MDDARELVNWSYARCPLGTAAGHFGPFRDVVQLWRDRMGPEGRLPRRSDFDFYDFKGWWGRVSIAKIERDPFDVRFVLWGTQLSEWWGVDYTNKRLGEASITPEIWAEVEGAYFREMDRAPFIGLVTGCLDQHERPDIRVMGVDLPLGPEEGDPAPERAPEIAPERAPKLDGEPDEKTAGETEGGRIAHVLSLHVQTGQEETIESVFPGIPGITYL